MSSLLLCYLLCESSSETSIIVPFGAILVIAPCGYITRVLIDVFSTLKAIRQIAILLSAVFYYHMFKINQFDYVAFASPIQRIRYILH